MEDLEIDYLNCVDPYHVQQSAVSQDSVSSAVNSHPLLIHLQHKLLVQSSDYLTFNSMAFNSMAASSEPDWEKARNWLKNEKVTRNSAKVRRRPDK